MAHSPRQAACWVAKHISIKLKRQIASTICSGYNALKMETNHKQKKGEKLRYLKIKQNKIKDILRQTKKPKLSHQLRLTM